MDRGTAYRLGQSDYRNGNASNPQKVPTDVMGNYEAGYEDAWLADQPEETEQSK